MTLLNDLLGKLKIALQALLIAIMEPKKPMLWDTKDHIRYNVRVIADEMGLSVADKNILCACIRQESNWRTDVIGPANNNGSHDYGLCQFNDGTYRGVPLWIGKGAAFTSTNEVLKNPEKCVRLMITMFKAGHKNWWMSYSTGAYKQWLQEESLPGVPY